MWLYTITIGELWASERLANTFSALVTVRPVLAAAIDRGERGERARRCGRPG